MRVRGSWFVAALAMALTGCTLKVDVPKLKLDTPKIDLDLGDTTTVDTTLRACSVKVGGGEAVDSGADALVEVDLGNLIYNVVINAPFTVEGVSGQFTTRTFSFLKQFENTGTSEINLAGEVSVTDAGGDKVVCGYSVKVKPAGSTALSCATAVSPASPKAGESFTFLASASGGVAPYTFSALTLGSGGTVVTGLSSISATAATATAKYSGTGGKVIGATLTDDNGDVVLCAKSITVQAATVSPAVTLTASPSTTVAAGNAISLTAAVSGFSATPSFTWTETESGVSLSSSKGVATVNATDGLAHTFDVTVKAQNGSEVSEATVSLSFTRSLALSCTLKHDTTKSYLVNKDVPFTVTTTTGETLVMTEIAGNTLPGTSAVQNVKFTSSGSKIVKAKAKATDGTLCNNGAYLQDSIFIYEPLSCKLRTSPAWSYEGSGDPVIVYAEIPANALIKGYAELMHIEANGGAFAGWYGYLGAWWDFSWAYPATYSYSGYITDDTGVEVNCDPTTHQVLPYYWW